MQNYNWLSFPDVNLCLLIHTNMVVVENLLTLALHATILQLILIIHVRLAEFFLASGWFSYVLCFKLKMLFSTKIRKNHSVFFNNLLINSSTLGSFPRPCVVVSNTKWSWLCVGYTILDQNDSFSSRLTKNHSLGTQPGEHPESNGFVYAEFIASGAVKVIGEKVIDIEIGSETARCLLIRWSAPIRKIVASAFSVAQRLKPSFSFTLTIA